MQIAIPAPFGRRRRFARRPRQSVAILVCPDDPLRIEERAQGPGVVEAAVLATGNDLGIVPFELHPDHIGR